MTDMPQKKELETSFHIVILVMFSVMSLLLDVIILISGWGAYNVLPVTALCVLCWCVHMGGFGSGTTRLYFYILIIILMLCYYASHPGTLTDIPILLCLFIIVLSRHNDGKLLLLVAGSYLIYIFENIFVIHYLTPETEQIVFSRLALGIICLITATVISLYFMAIGNREQEEKDRLRKEAEKAKNDTKRFLSNMSHELRTPINVVGGISELMLSENPSPEDEKRLYAIYSAGARMQRQVSDILSFSELQTGHFKLNEEEYEPVSVVNDVVHSVFTKARSGLDFAVDISPDIPRVLIGDAGRLKKIMVCLLDNAVKFTDAGGGYLYVSSREEEKGINLNIDVYDTGRGIDQRDRKKLFYGAYAGDDSTERKKGGLGLGLAIVHGIVEAMDGFIRIESSDRGTHVHVTIPQKVSDPTHSIGLFGVSQYHALCWFDKRKYVRREIGEYYYRIVDHVRNNLGAEVDVAASLTQFKEIVNENKITHIFIAEAEYKTDPDYFEKLAKHSWICVFAGPEFVPAGGSGIYVIQKPVYLLSVVNFLKQANPDGNALGISVHDENLFTKLPCGKKALVVDDEPMNLMVARGILEKMGVKTETASGGAEAVKLCKSQKFDVIFMDHMMPEMNGTDAMRAIRNLSGGYYRKRPIIVLTANAVSGAREVFLSDGFDEFLSKPVSMKEMNRMLKKIFQEADDDGDK